MFNPPTVSPRRVFRHPAEQRSTRPTSPDARPGVSLADRIWVAARLAARVAHGAPDPTLIAERYLRYELPHLAAQIARRWRIYPRHREALRQFSAEADISLDHAKRRLIQAALSELVCTPRRLDELPGTATWKLEVAQRAMRRAEHQLEQDAVIGAPPELLDGQPAPAGWQESEDRAERTYLDCIDRTCELLEVLTPTQREWLVAAFENAHLGAAELDDLLGKRPGYSRQMVARIRRRATAA